jgi:hypothetical protein
MADQPVEPTRRQTYTQPVRTLNGAKRGRGKMRNRKPPLQSQFTDTRAIRKAYERREK